MPTPLNSTITTEIDPAFVARIVREVIARLKAGRVATANHTRVDAKIIDAETIRRYAIGAELIVDAKAIVTPAAKDEAKLRKIIVHRGSLDAKSGGWVAPPNHPIEQPKKVHDAIHERAQAIEAQLVRRGIAWDRTVILISETPAREVANQFSSGKRSAMITSIDDVGRFGNEMDPQVWVLDMKRMNLMTVVNVIAAITRFQKARP